MYASSRHSATQHIWDRETTRIERLTFEAHRAGNVTTLLIADDHHLLREGLKALFRADPSFRVVGEASDGESVIPLVRELKPDILLLDWELSKKNGMTILRDLSDTDPPIRTILLTVEFDKAEVVQALQFGVWGVILKDSTSRMLFDAIHKVMAGEYWIGRERVANLIEALRAYSQAAHTQSALKDFGLTARELQIISTVVAGYSNPDIAESFSLSEHTVKHHISHIFDKLGVSNRLELALFAVNHRLIDNS